MPTKIHAGKISYDIHFLMILLAFCFQNMISIVLIAYAYWIPIEANFYYCLAYSGIGNIHYTI